MHAFDTATTSSPRFVMVMMPFGMVIMSNESGVDPCVHEEQGKRPLTDDEKRELEEELRSITETWP